MNINICLDAMTKQRYKITVEYDGTNYCGFQKQFDAKQKSIEEALEEAIFKMSQENVKLCASGRTDAGVHAVKQIIHFDLNKKFQDYQIILGLNGYLGKEDIAITNCELVDENFHARFNSKQRVYEYKIINRKAPLVLEKNRAWHVASNLDVDAMIAASKFLIGQHDFSSFRDAQCQNASPIKTIDDIDIALVGERITITIKAKSFLHHMVRNIVGTLVFVGTKRLEVKDMPLILEAKNRQKSGPNAPACGLYFLEVLY
jgi:tRNA pseudouridine38-40 synthase